MTERIAEIDDEVIQVVAGSRGNRFRGALNLWLMFVLRALRSIVLRSKIISLNRVVRSSQREIGVRQPLMLGSGYPSKRLPISKTR